MSVWLTIPSVRPLRELDACLGAWKCRGYRIGLLRQGPASAIADVSFPTEIYLGWARSTNILCRAVIGIDPGMTHCIVGGDDYFPSDVAPELIAGSCLEHFDGTFGVMQPTGDRWGDTLHSRNTYGQNRGAYIDRVAGSAWIGRSFIERAYLGNGPLWDGYHHCFADEELQEVATKLGVFWQRPDLTQYHDHPGRTKGLADWPPHLAPAITGANWDRDQKLFRERKLKGFPGHQPIEL